MSSTTTNLADWQRQTSNRQNSSFSQYQTSQAIATVRSLSELPGELLVKIFSYLDTESLKRVRLVSRFEMI